MGSRACIVSGSLFFVLNASRFFGTAPLRFVPLRNGYKASVSKFCLLYCSTITILLTVVAISALCIDMQVFLETRSLQFKVISYRNWIVDVITVTGNTLLCYCISKCRMTDLIRHVNIIDKITSKIDDVKMDMEKRNRKIIIILFFFLIMNTLQEPLLMYHQEKSANILMCIAIVIITNITTVLAELQLIFINIKVHNIFHMINNKLGKLIKLEYSQHSRLVNDCIYSLSLSHVCACELVNQVNKANGFYSMWLLLLSGVFIVFSGIDLSFNPSSDVNSELNRHEQIFYIIQRIIWITVIIFKTVIFVEPCHRINKETRDMKVLISQLMCHMTPIGKSLTLEVDIIFKEILLNKPEFTPLGIFTINRSLIIAMCSYITTYMVFSLQIKSQ